MSNLRKQYRDLEMQTLRGLRDKIQSSKTRSNFVSGKAIPVIPSVAGFKELAIVNGQTVFIDTSGNHYDLLASASLEDLMMILER